MPTTLTNGIQLPDKGSVDWYSSMQSNYNLIDTHLGDTDIHVTAEDKANWNSKQGSLSQAQLDAIAQVATNTSDIATLQSDKADASHTHSSSDITDIDDYATKDYVDNSISGLVDNAPDALNTLNELSAALNDDSNFASTVTTALGAKANSADLATVATSGSYNDLTNKPTIPTNTSDLTNDSDFVVSSNLATIATSGDYDDLSNKPSIPTNTSDLNNDSGFITLNDVPTKTSDLTNDSNFVDTSNSAVSSGITSAKVADYDTHVADTDIHVTTGDKTTWNTVTSKANDSDVVHLSGNETAAGKKTFSEYITSDGSSTGDEYSGNSKTNLWLMANRDEEDVSGVLFDSFRQNTAQGTGTHILGIGIKENGIRYEGCRFSWIWDNNLNGYSFSFRPTLQGANQAVEHNLGLSTDKWDNVYANKYYYGSSDTEFSDKFVTTDTAQTVSGSKTFSDLQIISYGTQYKGARNAYILPDFAAGYSGLSIATLGYSQTLKIGNFVLDANNKPSLDASKGYVQFAVGDNNNVNTCILEPKNIIASSLGTSANKWSEIHGTEYYYGSNNVEFSTKFVTTDTAQTISGNKVWTGTNTFQQNVTYQRTNFYHQSANPCYMLKDTELEKGNPVPSPYTAYPGLWQDKNGDILGYVRFVEYSSGRQTAELRVSNLIKNGALDPTGSEVNCAVNLELQPSGEKSLIPERNNDINLGTSTNKWKSFNGVEPSSLSLPSDRSARIDISSYITNLGNGGNNTYTVPANGYIFLHFTSINGALCYAQTPGGLTNYAQTFTRYQGDGQLYAFFPVRKDDNFVVQIYTSSTAEVQNAFFIPCQGNV